MEKVVAMRSALYSSDFWTPGFITTMLTVDSRSDPTPITIAYRAEYSGGCLLLHNIMTHVTATCHCHIMRLGLGMGIWGLGCRRLGLLLLLVSRRAMLYLDMQTYKGWSIVCLF